MNEHFIKIFRFIPADIWCIDSSGDPKSIAGVGLFLEKYKDVIKGLFEPKKLRMVSQSVGNVIKETFLCLYFNDENHLSHNHIQ